MADEKAEGGGGEGGGDAPKPARKLNLQLMLVLGNSILFLGALGILVYTKILYQRPVITEEAELAQKKAEIKEPIPVTERPVVNFDVMTLNIATTSGKAHYVTLNFALECKNESISDFVKRRKAVFTDRIVVIMAKKQVTELNTIQGRLFVKNDLIRDFNAMLAKQTGTTGAITAIYFPTFILQ